jgi:hypothetical protein
VLEDVTPIFLPGCVARFSGNNFIATTIAAHPYAVLFCKLLNVQFFSFA